MTQKRTQKDLEIDRETEKDRLSDAELESAVVTFPKKTAKIALNMRIEPEVVDLAKQVAEARHLDGYTQLLRLYIREGLERDRPLLEKS
ncbi:MAG: hypothetical protein O7G87_04700 [bacterium]|nr:hypothetical protein [bacterium]